MRSTRREKKERGRFVRHRTQKHGHFLSKKPGENVEKTGRDTDTADITSVTE